MGVGAWAAGEGEIRATEDVVGLFARFTPRFVKRYAELGEQVERAAAAYAEDVRARRFPGPEHCVGIKKPGKGRRG